MAKNIRCKICGRTDFDDKGEHLVCRACGEKRKKHQLSKLHLLCIPVLFIFGIYSEILASLINVYKADAYSPDFKAHPFLAMIRSKFTKRIASHKSYNELDLLMIQLRNHLVWLDPLFRILGLVLFGLAVYFIIMLYRDLKKAPLKGELYVKE